MINILLDNIRDPTYQRHAVSRLAGAGSLGRDGTTIYILYTYIIIIIYTSIIYIYILLYVQLCIYII